MLDLPTAHFAIAVQCLQLVLVGELAVEPQAVWRRLGEFVRERVVGLIDQLAEVVVVVPAVVVVLEFLSFVAGSVAERRPVAG